MSITDDGVAQEQLFYASLKRPILSQEEIDTYHRDGYLVPGLRLTGAKLARLQQLSDELIERNAEFGDTPMVCPHVPGGGVQGLRGDKAWFDYSADPDILDMVGQLIGEDIILWGTNLFHKPPGKNTDRGGRRIPFHRDGRYWPIEPLKTLTVWLAIEDHCGERLPADHPELSSGRPSG